MEDRHTEPLARDAAQREAYRVEVVVMATKDESLGIAAAIVNATDFRHIGPIIVQPCVVLSSEEALRGD